jgi:hypothetical protein
LEVSDKSVFCTSSRRQARQPSFRYCRRPAAPNSTMATMAPSELLGLLSSRPRSLDWRPRTRLSKRGLPNRKGTRRYHALHTKVDSKQYYLPQDRTRGYLVALDAEAFGPGAEADVAEIMQMILKLQRKASSSVGRIPGR